MELGWIVGNVFILLIPSCITPKETKKLCERPECEADGLSIDYAAKPG